MQLPPSRRRASLSFILFDKWLIVMEGTNVETTFRKAYDTRSMHSQGKTGFFSDKVVFGK